MLVIFPNTAAVCLKEKNRHMLNSFVLVGTFDLLFCFYVFVIEKFTTKVKIFRD